MCQRGVKITGGSGKRHTCTHEGKERDEQSKEHWYGVLAQKGAHILLFVQGRSKGRPYKHQDPHVSYNREKLHREREELITQTNRKAQHEHRKMSEIANMHGAHYSYFSGELKSLSV